MTHIARNLDRTPIPWAECYMERYSTNNGIVLYHDPHRDHRRRIVYFIDGADLGLAKTDREDLAFPRAEPIFKMFLTIHAQSLEIGRESGRRQVQAELRAALES